MNGGGVFELLGDGDAQAEVYACYDPAGVRYFTRIMDTGDTE